jgi:hypothetical protein
MGKHDIFNLCHLATLIEQHAPACNKIEQNNELISLIFVSFVRHSEN